MDPVYSDGQFDASGPGPAAADQARVDRAFVNFFATVFNDNQNYVGEDNSLNNPPGQFFVVNPGYGWAVQGTTVSSLNQGATTAKPAAKIPLSWIVIGTIALLVLRK